VPDSATAVATAPVLLGNQGYLAAVGLDNGHLLVFVWLPGKTDAWTQLAALDSRFTKHTTILLINKTDTVQLDINAVKVYEYRGKWAFECAHSCLPIHKMCHFLGIFLN